MLFKVIAHWDVFLYSSSFADGCCAVCQSCLGPRVQNDGSVRGKTAGRAPFFWTVIHAAVFCLILLIRIVIKHCSLTHTSDVSGSTRIKCHWLQPTSIRNAAWNVNYCTLCIRRLQVPAGWVNTTPRWGVCRINESWRQRCSEDWP